MTLDLYSEMMWYANIKNISAEIVGHYICDEVDRGTSGLYDDKKKWTEEIDRVWAMGEVGSPIAAAPHMKKFLQNVMGLSKEAANKEVMRIKRAWRKTFEDYKVNFQMYGSPTNAEGDIGTWSFDMQESNVDPATGHYRKSISVNTARQKNSGNMTIRGKISKITEDCKGIVAISAICGNCGIVNTLMDRKKFGRPKLFNPINKSVLAAKKCLNCEQKAFPISPEDLTLELVNVSLLEIQDEKSLSQSDHLKLMVTEEVDLISKFKINDKLLITGRMYVEPEGGGGRFNSGRLMPILHAKKITLDRKSRDTTVSEKTRYIVKIFTERQLARQRAKGIEKPDILNALTEFFAPNLYGEAAELGKLAILLSSVSAKEEPLDSITGLPPMESNIIMVCLIGSSGTGKSALSKYAAKINPIHAVIDAPNTTTKSYVGIMQQNRDGSITAVPGAAAEANGGVILVDEFDTLYKDQEGQDRLAKIISDKYAIIRAYGKSATFLTQASVIFILNPVNGEWKDAYRIFRNELPLKQKILDRLDLFVIFRMPRDPHVLEDILRKMSEYDNRKIKPDYSGLFIDYINVCKTDFANPTIPDTSNEAIIQYAKSVIVSSNNALWGNNRNGSGSSGGGKGGKKYQPTKEDSSDGVDLGGGIGGEDNNSKGNSGTRASFRVVKSIRRLSIGIATLRQHKEVTLDDVEKAKEAYGQSLKNLQQVASIDEEPEQIAIDEIYNVLRRNPNTLILSNEVAAMAAKANPIAKKFLGTDDPEQLTIRNSRVMRYRIIPKLKLDPEHIYMTANPIMLEYRSKNSSSSSSTTASSNPNSESDNNNKDNPTGDSSSTTTPPPPPPPPKDNDDSDGSGESDDDGGRGSNSNSQDNSSRVTNEDIRKDTNDEIINDNTTTNTVKEATEQTTYNAATTTINDSNIKKEKSSNEFLSTSCDGCDAVTDLNFVKNEKSKIKNENSNLTKTESVTPSHASQFDNKNIIDDFSRASNTVIPDQETHSNTKHDQQQKERQGQKQEEQEQQQKQQQQEEDSL